MVIEQKGNYENGYNTICKIGNGLLDMDMDIGVIRLDDGYCYSNDDGLERVILLIEGDVIFNCRGESYHAVRKSCFDEKPIVIHLPRFIEVTIEGLANSELIYQAVENDNKFEPKIYCQEDMVTEAFRSKGINDTKVYSIRRIIDDDASTYSNLAIGEVINYPGRSSSYPSNNYVQPIVYHYRFLPKQGFGVSLIGENVHKVEDRFTSCVRENHHYPHSSAPGYAMYFVWMMSGKIEKV